MWSGRGPRNRFEWLPPPASTGLLPTLPTLPTLGAGEARPPGRAGLWDPCAQASAQACKWASRARRACTTLASSTASSIASVVCEGRKPRDVCEASMACMPSEACMAPAACKACDAACAARLLPVGEPRDEAGGALLVELPQQLLHLVQLVVVVRVTLLRRGELRRHLTSRIRVLPSCPAAYHGQGVLLLGLLDHLDAALREDVGSLVLVVSLLLLPRVHKLPHKVLVLLLQGRRLVGIRRPASRRPASTGVNHNRPRPLPVHQPVDGAADVPVLCKQLRCDGRVVHSARGHATRRELRKDQRHLLIYRRLARRVVLRPPLSEGHQLEPELLCGLGLRCLLQVAEPPLVLEGGGDDGEVREGLALDHRPRHRVDEARLAVVRELQLLLERGQSLGLLALDIALPPLPREDALDGALPQRVGGQGTQLVELLDLVGLVPLEHGEGRTLPRADDLQRVVELRLRSRCGSRDLAIVVAAARWPSRLLLVLHELVERVRRVAVPLAALVEEHHAPQVGHHLDDDAAAALRVVDRYSEGQPLVGRVGAAHDVPCHLVPLGVLGQRGIDEGEHAGRGLGGRERREHGLTRLDLSSGWCRMGGLGALDDEPTLVVAPLQLRRLALLLGGAPLVHHAQQCLDEQRDEERARQPGEVSHHHGAQHVAEGDLAVVGEDVPEQQRDDGQQDDDVDHPRKLELGLAVASRELLAALPHDHQPAAHVAELRHDLSVRPATHELLVVVHAQLLVHVHRRGHHVLALHLALRHLLLVLDGEEGLRVLVGPRAAVRLGAAAYQSDDGYEARPCERLVGHVHWDDLMGAGAAAAGLLVEVISHTGQIIHGVMDEVVDRVDDIAERDSLPHAAGESRHYPPLLLRVLLGLLLGDLLLRLALLVLLHRAAGRGHSLAALEHTAGLEAHHLAVQHRLVLAEIGQLRLEIRDLGGIELRRGRRRRRDGRAAEEALLLGRRWYQRGTALDERVATFQGAGAVLEGFSEGPGQRVGRDAEGLLEGEGALAERHPQVLGQLEVDHADLAVVQSDVVVPHLHAQQAVAAQRLGAHLDHLPLGVEILRDHLGLAEQVHEAIGVARLEDVVGVARGLGEDVTVKGRQLEGA
eukprot:scaffold99105_cov60-Phaeocystis_antarctica.AAC.19